MRLFNRQPHPLLSPVLLATAAFLASTAASSGQTPADFDDLRQQIEELRQTVARLEAERNAGEAPVVEASEEASSARDERRFAEIERRIEILATELERVALGELALGESALGTVAARTGEQETSVDIEKDRSRDPETGEHGLGIAASKVYRRSSQGVSLGGYGEMTYQSFDSLREDGSPSGQTDELDALRSVIYVGYKFSDRWLFNSEIEVEHGSTAEDGEVSLELSYLDYLWRPQVNLRAGLVLVPLGLVNELHEPTLFWSANRPETERRIIPTTWRETGVGVFGDVGPFSYRAYALNGFDASGFSSSGLRGGRQKGSRAKAEDLALAARFDYTARPGLLVGAAGYVGDSGQDIADASGQTVGASTEIFDLHFDWRYRGLHLRGLWARASIDDASRLNQALGLAGDAAIAERLGGRYFEAGYDLFSRRRGEASLMPFFRIETVNSQQRVPAGFSTRGSSELDILTLGIAYQPLDELVFKLDFQDRSDRSRTAVDQWSLALGYLF